MVLKLYDENDIQNIANSIRLKNQETDVMYTVSQMPEAINNIKTEKSVQFTANDSEVSLSNTASQVIQLKVAKAGKYKINFSAYRSSSSVNITIKITSDKKTEALFEGQLSFNTNKKFTTTSICFKIKSIWL